jgi:outer membrane protein assembly factor BamB
MFHHDLSHSGYSTSTAPKTNQTLWKYGTGSVRTSPDVANGIVYVGSATDGNVYALNMTTGVTVWQFKTGNAVYSSPAVANGIVYVGSSDDDVYALNATTSAVTNRLVWKYPTGGGVESSPAIANGVVYVGSDDNRTYALNATTGALVWEYTTGYDVRSSPAVANGVVYVGSWDRNVYALNATTTAVTNRLVWKYTTGWTVDSSPAVANGIVYVGSDDDKVYAINATTGKQVWNYTTGFDVYSSPAVANGIVYVGSDDDNVYALITTTGTLVWKYTTGGYVESSPAVANGTVYVGSDDNNIYALNAATGALVWKYKTSSAVYSPPAVASGSVYVGGWDGNVYAFGSIPLSVSISPSSVLMSFVGQSQTFASTVTGGTAPYKYQWYLNSAAVSGANGSSWTFTSSSTGFFTVYLRVTDSVTPAPNTRQSGNASVTVVTGSLLSVYISPTSATIGLDQSQTYTSSVSGGLPPYSYQWYLQGNVVPGATSGSWTFKPSSAGVYDIYVNITDALSTVRLSSTAQLKVTAGGLGLLEMALIGVVVAAVACVGAGVYKLRKRPPKPPVTPPPPAPTKLVIQTEPAEILADGKSTSTVTVKLQDDSGRLITALADTEVKIATTRGTLETPVVKIPKGKDTETTVITSSTESGPVTVSASALGLQSMSTTLNFAEKKRFCMHCGVLIPFRATRCPKCGKTPPAGFDTKACKNCSAVIPVVAKFCSECGAGQAE